jgi:hypothetical protein
MTLGNGDRVPIRQSVRFVIESTPADFERLNAVSAVPDGNPVFFDESVVTCRMLAQGWLRTRRVEEAALIEELFDRGGGRWLEDVVAFLRDEARSPLFSLPLFLLFSSSTVLFFCCVY